MTQEKIDVLIVDDRPQNLMALEATLTDMDLNIVRAATGREALRYVLKHNFAVILLDVQMPEMDGFETAELIRQRQRSQHTPIIFITANSSEEIHFIRGYSLGAVDYIPKPFKPEILRSKVSVFVELFKKSLEIQKQAENLASINQKLESEIQERKKAEEAIRESEIRFRAMFENAGIGMSLRSLDGYFLKANPALERIVGYSSNELQKMHFSVITHINDRQSDLELYESLVQGGREQYQIDKRYVRKNGDIIWARTVVSIVKNLLGKPLYAVCMSEDITAQKLYTEQLQKLTEELAQSNSELIIAKENAEEANRAKTAFLSNMSHELRTPLNAILGFAQILKKDHAIPEKQRGFLDTMYRSGHHLLEMINDVLDNSKIESGKMELFPQDFNLHLLIKELEGMFTLRSNEKGVVLNVSYDESTPSFIYADAKRLRQILINLLGNAVKFTSDGEIHLHVIASPVLIKNGKREAHLKFTVSDTGRGISKEHIHTIFEPFHQTTGSYSEGSGLGLAISRRIAHLMNGEITVESEVGVGSVFTFELTVQLPETERNQIPESSNILGIQNGLRYRVLLLGPDSLFRKRIRDILEPLGFVCSEIENFSSAKKLSETFKPHLIISDGALQKRKNSFEFPCPALLISEKATSSDTKKNICLTKNFRDAELLDSIGKILEIDYIFSENNIPSKDQHKHKIDDANLQSIAAKIMMLPAEYCDDLCDAIEVQDLEHILLVLDRAEQSGLQLSSELITLRNAASHAGYRFLVKLSDALRKTVEQ